MITEQLLREFRFKKKKIRSYILNYTSNKYGYLIGRNKSAKTDEFFLPLTNFFADHFLYRRIFLPTFFFTNENI